MGSEILSGVIELIERELKPVSSKRIDENTTMKELDLDSMSFIKLISAIEEKYGFKFDDEKLVYEVFPDILSIVDYIMFKIKNRRNKKVQGD